MRELVKLAEVREARAKEEMARLLEARAEVYDAGASNAGARDAEGSTTAAAGAALACSLAGNLCWPQFLMRSWH